MIDDIDRRILELVQADARRSNKDLAAAVGVSPSTMVNRLRNLEQAGVIRGYHAEVDQAHLGRDVQAMVMVTLQPKSPAAVAEFEAAIWKLEQTIAISLMTGEFDILVHMSDRSVPALAETVLSRVASAPNVVSERTSIVFEHRRKPALRALTPDD
ncbi:MAG: Lrp/AsnC family transcriptional regulator [Actinomycetota bacterium]